MAIGPTFVTSFLASSNTRQNPTINMNNTAQYNPSMMPFGLSKVGNSSLIPRSPGLMARAQTTLVPSEMRTGYMLDIACSTTAKEITLVPLTKDMIFSRLDHWSRTRDTFGHERRRINRMNENSPLIGIAICNLTKRMLAWNCSGVMISAGTAS